MDFFTHLNQALQNLIHSKLRSFLAVLGILVGTGSVVALIMAGDLATRHALAQFDTLGTNLLGITLASSNRATSGASFQWEDLPKLYRSDQKQIQLIAPYITLSQSVYAQGRSSYATVLATTENFFKIAKVQIEKGRLISVLDRQQLVCDIGSSLAKQFSDRGVSPIGKSLLVGKQMYEIVGVLKKWQPNYFLYEDINTGVVVPLGTAKMLSASANISSFIFRLVPHPNLVSLKPKIKNAFFRLLPSYRVYMRDPQQIINIVNNQQKTLSMMLVAIASISLFVGGVGVMNIMLVSVVERRRSIGVRMAIGARRIDILKMFLIESVLLTLFGGCLGVVAGLLVSFGVAHFNQWQFFIDWAPIVMGFSVSVLVGVVSGWYPALRASRLDPIQILTQ